MWQNNISTGNQTIQSELGAGEKLLWSGQPRGGIRFRSSDIFLIPFSLMWGGFAIFWEIMAVIMFFAASNDINAPPVTFTIIFPLWGIPFVLVGLYMIFGRFIVDAKSRKRTYYAVTEQRIIIISTLFGHRVQSLNLRQLPELSLKKNADESGTISFGSTNGIFNFWGNSSWPGARRYQVPSFEMVDNVREVYEIIQSAQQQAK